MERGNVVLYVGWNRCKQQLQLCQPSATNTKSATKASDRKGLEDAIRLSLCALQERLAQSSTSELPVSPPPGLAPSASVEAPPSLSKAPEVPQAQGQEQDVMQLLNLRGLLLDRLLQKEDNVQAYNQATFMAMQQMQDG
ncbi:ML2 [Symbiodinium natans]|uniref:ML2 protein n=1 Tax=Symbiodinium natans TaxID=878477 RepID=A0A812NBQ2_9DINO|nr:ML2 [Symbiodinium natans]